MVGYPRCRRRINGGQTEDRLQQLAREVRDEMGAWIVALETMPDHGPLTDEVDPKFGAHRLAKAIKGRRSRVPRDEFPNQKLRLPTLRIKSYLVATTGGSPLAAVKEYVEQRKNR